MATKVKVTKTSQIFSDNEKMDNSGLAGKPKTYELMMWKEPKMTIEDIMEAHEMKTNKHPDTDD